MRVPLPLRSQKQRWPLWARLAFRTALKKQRSADDAAYRLPGHDVCLQPRTRRFLAEACHGAADDGAEELLNARSARDLEDGEGAEEEAIEDEGDVTAADKAASFKQLMEYAAQDRKEGVYLPLAGNLYQYWGLGINDWMAPVTRDLGLLAVVIVQVLAPPACIIFFYYQLDLSKAEISLEDWHYRYHSRTHGISNMLKHFTAVLFLFLFALNGAMVIHTQKVIALKVNAILDKCEPSFHQSVRRFWIHLGRLLNCSLILECCIIVYLALVYSEGPVDVVFNSLAVTFLYNLDDIEGDMSFLSDDDWDGEELGKLYYMLLEDFFAADPQTAIDKDGVEVTLDPDDIHKHDNMGSMYRDWVFSITENVMYLMIVLLPCLYIFVSGIQTTPTGTEDDVAELQRQVAELLKASRNN